MPKQRIQFPRRDPAWRVLWADYRGHHDFVGRAPVSSGGVHKRARPVKPPEQQHRDFFARSAADDFVKRLKEWIPVDELVVQVVALPQRHLPEPEDRMLPGDWPWWPLDFE